MPAYMRNIATGLILLALTAIYPTVCYCNACAGDCNQGVSDKIMRIFWREKNKEEKSAVPEVVPFYRAILNYSIPNTAKHKEIKTAVPDVVPFYEAILNYLIPNTAKEKKIKTAVPNVPFYQSILNYLIPDTAKEKEIKTAMPEAVPLHKAILNYLIPNTDKDKEIKSVVPESRYRTVLNFLFFDTVIMNRFISVGNIMKIMYYIYDKTSNIIIVLYELPGRIDKLLEDSLYDSFVGVQNICQKIFHIVMKPFQLVKEEKLATGTSEVVLLHRPIIKYLQGILSRFLDGTELERNISLMIISLGLGFSFTSFCLFICNLFAEDSVEEGYTDEELLEAFEDNEEFHRNLEILLTPRRLLSNNYMPVVLKEEKDSLIPQEPHL